MSSTDLKVYDEKEIKDKLQKSLDSWNYDGKWIRKVFKSI